MVEDGRRILSNVVSTQAALHALYGGVVPEVAARHHLENICPVIEKAMGRKVDDTPPMPEDYVMPAIPRAWAERSGDENIKQMLEKIQEDRAAGRRDPAAGIIGGNL